MAAHILEETLDLDCATLQPVVPAHGEPWPSYPHVLLRPNGSRQMVTLRMAVLENACIRAGIALDLGGRMLSLRDRRTGSEVLPLPRVLEPEPSGPRGAWLGAGAQVMADGPFRAQSMGAVEFQAQEGEDGEPANLLLHELVAGAGLSWHATWTLPPESPWVDLSVRVLNRSLRAAAYCGGLRLRLGGAVWTHPSCLANYDLATDSGVVVVADPGTFEAASWHGEDLALFRHYEREEGQLGPRQTDSWQVRLVPVSGLGGLTAFSPGAAMHIAERQLRLLVAEPMPGAKVVVQLDDGRTLEAPVSPEPGAVLRLDLADLRGEVAGIALRDASKAERLRWVASEPMTPLADGCTWVDAGIGRALPRERLYLQGLAAFEEGRDATAELVAATHEPGLRAPALVVLAMQATRAQDWTRADRFLEEALLFNAEDHLAWWLKAVVRRLADGPETERPELPNAHYLAPLEPALRAESFLSIAAPLGRDPNPILAPLAGHPEALAEIACLLLDAGLTDQAAKFLDEALRHGDHANLRYLLAWTLLRDARLEAEAAEHVRRAAAKPVEPPFPWRRIEARALTALVARFPGDARLRTLGQGLP